MTETKVTPAQKAKLLVIAERYLDRLKMKEIEQMLVEEDVQNNGIGGWYGRTNTYNGIYIVVLEDGSSHS